MVSLYRILIVLFIASTLLGVSLAGAQPSVGELEVQRDREETLRKNKAQEADDEVGNERENWYDDEARQRFFASASLGVDYSRGDYGEPKDTTFIAVPVAIKLEWDPITFRTSIPFLYKDGVDDVIPGIGGGDDGASTSTSSGIGDVVTSLMYTYYSGTKFVPIVDVIVKVKIPTGSESNGFSTGKTDVTLQLETTEVFGPFSIFGGAGYRFKGGGPYDDIIVAGGGMAFRFSKGFSAGVAYDYREAATSASDDVQEASLFMTLRMSKRARLGPYAVVGFSDASPDYGGGLTLTVDVW